jgi:hypothetical protein
VNGRVFRGLLWVGGNKISARVESAYKNFARVSAELIILNVEEPLTLRCDRSQ